MFTRGFHDPVLLWPTVFWPIVISSCFYAYVRICQMLRERYGFSPINGRRLSDFAVRYVLIPFGIAVEVMVHGYMFYLIGYQYLVVLIPVYVVGWVLLPAVLEGWRPGLTVLALSHGLFAAAFAVLLGFFHFGVLKVLNEDLYGLLIGVPVVF